ncbi:MAG: TIR domain-containing protein [Pseudomonadota bacterium]
MKPNHVVFISYAHDDDAYDSGGIKQLAGRLERSIRAFTGQRDLQVFFDQQSIEWGDAWRTRIAEGLGESTLLITVVTPTYLSSTECRNEFEDFLSQPDREKWLLPIYYIDVPDLEKRDDPVSERMQQRQYADWRELRMTTPSSIKVRKAVESLATRIRDLLKASRSAESGMPVEEQTLEYRAQSARPPDEDVDWFDYAMEARALADMEEFGLARALLTGAMEQFGQEGNLFFELATVDWYDGWLEDAVKHFEVALTAGVDRLDVLQGLGQVRIETGDYERGIRELDEVIASHTDAIAAAYARSSRALGIAALGNHDEALDELQSAELETPGNSWLHFNRGLILDWMENPRAVSSYVNSLILNEPPLNRPKRLMAQERLAGLSIGQ